MKRYRVVFTNGEKRELVVLAENVSEQDESYVFAANHSKVAVVPIKQVLYIKETEED